MAILSIVQSNIQSAFSSNIPTAGQTDPTFVLIMVAGGLSLAVISAISWKRYIKSKEKKTKEQLK